MKRDNRSQRTNHLPSFVPSVTTIPLLPPTTVSKPTLTYTPFVLPESHYLKIAADKQYFALGCEASAAVDLAEYYDILIYQYNFQHELPLSDNPDLGFVGDAKGPWGQIPPYAYGVHAAPVVDLLQKYGLDVEGGKGYSLEQLKAENCFRTPRNRLGDREHGWRCAGGIHRFSRE